MRLAQVSTDNANTLRPPILRWAGSKKRSLPAIIPFLPPDTTRYMEVFAGSACLFFHLAPNSAVVSDNNVELIRFYRTISKEPRKVYRRFKSFVRDASTYYAIRRTWTSERDPLVRAAYFLYLNRNCFNGIYRTNSRGQFNVPFAEDRVPKYPSEASIEAAAYILKKAKLKSADFEDVCSESVSGDFVYLDPPYYLPSKRVFREYSSDPFDLPDFQRLESVLHRIDKKGAQFLLSYPDCSAATELARRWNFSRINVRRTVAGSVAARGRARELLIFNYAAPHAEF